MVRLVTGRWVSSRYFSRQQFGAGLYTGGATTLIVLWFFGELSGAFAWGAVPLLVLAGAKYLLLK